MGKPHVLTYQGQTKPLKEWADCLGMDRRSLWQRIFKLGIPAERALSPDFTPRRPPRNYDKTASMVCANCGGAYVIPKSRQWREKCCSTECKNALREKKLNEAAESRRRPCGYCGESFIPRQWQLDAGDGHLCGAQCRADYLRLKTTVTGRSKAAAAVRAKAVRRSRTRERLPDGTRQRLFLKQQGKCAFCRRSIQNGCHLDHIIPLARGGKHEALNLQLLCKPCNLRKHAMDPIVFAQMHGRLL